MIEALWSIHVAVEGSAFPPQGGGVVVLETGRVLGGDGYFTYVGDFKIENGSFIAHVHIKQFEPFQPGIGSMTGLTDYHATFTGKVDEQKMLITGVADGNPSVRMHAELTRRAELP